MSTERMKRLAFRPSLGGSTLEDRVVLSTTRTGIVAAAALHAAQSQQLVTSQELLQVRTTFAQQFRAAYNDLRNYAFNQVISAYNDAGLTPRQRLDFTQFSNLMSTIGGALNATALRVSAQYNLLPASDHLTNNFQTSLLSSARQSLVTQLLAIGNSRSATRSETALLNSINRVINNNALQNLNKQNAYFRNTNFNAALASSQGAQAAGISAAAVRPAATTGTSALQQFMLNRAVNQFNNGFGALGSAFNNAALNSVYGGNANNAFDPNGLTNLSSQFNNATTNLGFQLSSALAAVPGLTNQNRIVNNLQTGFYGNGTNPGLVTSLDNAFGTSPSFSNLTNSVNGAFNNAYGQLAGSLSTLTGQTLPTVNPVTGNFTNLFGSNFTSPTFNGGFNTGFGTGFPGFGTVPSNLNNFNTGFTGLANNFATSSGFTVPTGTGFTIPTGTGTGTGFGTGTGLA